MTFAGLMGRKTRASSKPRRCALIWRSWRAEQALRPALVNGKSWGGNRSRKGAHTQHVALSVIRTARQQRQDPIELMVAAQRRPGPAVSKLLRLPARASPSKLAA